VLKADPAVVGGVMIKIGDRVVDASVRGRLNQLRNSLLK
jgi:F0F1-type ATP synthase delta subunit